MEKDYLTIGVSTRALFDMEFEHRIFLEQGTRAYVEFELEHQNEVLAPGPAFRLMEAFLALNQKEKPRMTEVVIMSKNSADASLRIFHSIEHYGLDITKAALTTGASIAPYLKAYHVDLYLSCDEEDVRRALDSGVAAGLILQGEHNRQEAIHQIRIAFDGDAVLFSDESERFFQEEGMEAFCVREKEQARNPLPKGPFAGLLMAISKIQQQYAPDRVPIRTALVTARSAPAHERVIRTLQAWGVRIDEAFFLGGMDKSLVLEAFGAHIFFDDNETNVRDASRVVLSARVPGWERSA